jgi:membrane protease YdiL (CAAX protease family)
MVAAWVGCYLVANLLAAVAVALTGYGGTEQGAQPIWVLVIAATALWLPFLGTLRVLSRQYGTGRWRDDYRLELRPFDLVGLPIGVLSQLVLVNLVNWPLRELFPDTFSPEQVEERARELYQRAEGVWLVALVLVVVAGAPLVEELVYRGFIQGTLRSRVDDMLALVITAVWFTLIHLRPVEFPGLFAFSLVLGACFHLTGRLGLPIMAHVAFNATGLALVASG